MWTTYIQVHSPLCSHRWQHTKHTAFPLDNLFWRSFLIITYCALSFITIAGMHISNGYRHWQQLLKRLQSCIWEILKVRACVGILYAERIQLEMPVLHRTSLAPSSWQTQACGPGRGSLINQPTEGRVCTGQGLHLQAWHLTTVNFNFYFLWWGS